MEKLALIDLGSNSARLVIVKVLEGGYYSVINEWKEAVRLGQDMERDGFLKPQRIQHTIKQLKMYKRLCDSYGVSKIIAVATAAVRRAKNQKSFLEEVYSSTGLLFRVLSAQEEAKYVYQGVINSMDIPKGVILEIGGGSTKIVYYNRRNILNFETLPFGSVTLTEKYALSGLSHKEQTQKVEEYFTAELNKIPWLKEIDPDTRLIGVGGSFRNLAKMSAKVRRYPLDMVHNYQLPKSDFINIYEMIRGLDLDRKMNIKGMSTGRADILPSAFAAMKSMADYINAEDFVISSSGLREGILFNTVCLQTLEKPISDVLGHSLLTFIHDYELNYNHTDQVINLSLQLFKQLRVLHKFPRSYIKVLRVAAALHDAGERVKFYDHQDHSTYIILNSNLFGITHKDLVMAAFVAGCHHRENVQPLVWARYKELVNEDDLDAVKKLGVILRIAESLDKSMMGVVKSINCDVLGDSVIMKTEIEGDGALEIKDAMSALPEFKRAFKKNLEIL